jgi:hypothetical protein
MSIHPAQKSLLPELDGRALDFIKICAALLMVVDHVNHIFFDRSYALMTLAGRAVLPLFCYAIAVGIKRAGPDHCQKYVLRLIIWGLLVEPISQITKDQASANILITLGLGVLFTQFSMQIKSYQLYAFYTIGIAYTLTMPPTIEYGLAGLLLPSAFYHVFQQKKQAMFFLFLLLMAVNANDIIKTWGQASSTATFVVTQILVGIGVIILPYVILKLGSFIPQTGRYLSKYFLYIFYPVHLLLIKAFTYLY